MLLRAATGFEGGTVASGSTCGVVTSGALAIALLHDHALKERGLAAEIDVIGLIEKYIDWFTVHFGTTICRVRTEVDFNRVGGQIRYLLPGDRMARCFRHITEAVNYLDPVRAGTSILLNENDTSPREMPSYRCARSVLEKVRERTGVGDSRVERLSFVFDGGIGLTGGLCGALAGGVMALNMLFGIDVRHMSYLQILSAFLVGHVNLLLERPRGMPEPFGLGSTLAKNFASAAGSLECSRITARTFENWHDFADHMNSSSFCHGLIDHTADMASMLIETWRPFVRRGAVP